MKKDSISKKAHATFSRNYLKMHQLFWDHEKPSKFIMTVISIRKVLGIFEDLPFKDIYREANGDTKKFYALEDKYRKDQTDFLKSNEHYKVVLREGVATILRKNSLGAEWEEMVTLAIITGACSPPMYSVSISRDKEKGTITLTLNRDTTKNDLDVAWKYTEDFRKSLFGDNHRAAYPTKKTFSNHNEYVEAIIAKVENPETEDVDSEDGVTNYIPVRDDHIIPIIYPDDEGDDLSVSPEIDRPKTDRNRLNKMRVNRHRQKKIRGV